MNNMNYLNSRSSTNFAILFEYLVYSGNKYSHGMGHGVKQRVWNEITHNFLVPCQSYRLDPINSSRLRVLITKVNRGVALVNTTFVIAETKMPKTLFLMKYITLLACHILGHFSDASKIPQVSLRCRDPEAQNSRKLAPKLERTAQVDISYVEWLIVVLKWGEISWSKLYAWNY
jgi:hypothetical protein